MHEHTRGWKALTRARDPSSIIITIVVTRSRRGHAPLPRPMCPPALVVMKETNVASEYQGGRCGECEEEAGTAAGPISIG
jgi:hypothetical protein